MAKDTDKVIQKVIKLLYDSGANGWSVQDKGALLAAVKLQLVEKPEKSG